MENSILFLFFNFEGFPNALHLCLTSYRIMRIYYCCNRKETWETGTVKPAIKIDICSNNKEKQT